MMVNKQFEFFERLGLTALATEKDVKRAYVPKICESSELMGPLEKAIEKKILVATAWP
jgi:hypothetical protein